MLAIFNPTIIGTKYLYFSLKAFGTSASEATYHTRLQTWLGPNIVGPRICPTRGRPSPAPTLKQTCDFSPASAPVLYQPEGSGKDKGLGPSQFFFSNIYFCSRQPPTLPSIFQGDTSIVSRKNIRRFPSPPMGFFYHHNRIHL